MENFKEEAIKAAEVVRAGGIILYPTDTIWGIGCDATNPAAVQKVYDIKQRDPDKPLIILVDNENKIPYYVREVPDVTWELLDVADKPMTIVFRGARNLAPNLTAADGTIGIRVCRDPFCRELLRLTRVPLVSTSANFSSQPAPVDFKSIDPELPRLVDHVCMVNLEMKGRNPSSVISLGPGGEITVIRR